MKDTKVTMYKTVFEKTPYITTLGTVLNRIKDQKAKATIDLIQKTENKEERDSIKKTLPVVLFSGTFKNERNSNNLIQHSGIVILDFDKVEIDVEEKKKQLMTNPFILAAFVSPSGNGVKALVRIKDKTKHTEHYLSILKDFPDADKSTKDVSRACFECSDKDILINWNCVEYTKILKSENVIYSERVEMESDVQSTFDKLCKWLENKNEIYQSGNRNNFIFTLAGACCRYGIDQMTTEYMIDFTYLSKDSQFTRSEMKTAINSAYKKNVPHSAKFDNGKLVDRKTMVEITIDLCEAIKDVIYAKEVRKDALKIFKNGYESAELWGIGLVDSIWKPKRGEITCITGIGNFGKSHFINYLLICKSLKDGSKWAVFSPESYPAHDFYHSLVEIFLGVNCTPFNFDGTPNLNIPEQKEYEMAYDYISDHFFYVFPKETSPTPQYIQSIFLELIIKEKCDGVMIDPFNQLENDYKGDRDDRYLTTFLSECKNFANINNVFFFIVSHPKQMQKNMSGNYPEPDVYDLAGGAMWNNKMDNILVYHRPDINNIDEYEKNRCKLITRKIKRQNIVGKRGDISFQFISQSRQFDFEDAPLKTLIKKSIDPDKKEFKTEIIDNYNPKIDYIFDPNVEIPF